MGLVVAMERGVAAGVGGAPGLGGGVREALAHPAVVRLADILKIDLSDEAQLAAVLAAAEDLAKKASSRPSVLQELSSDPVPVDPRRASTAYQVAEALKSYRQVGEL